MDAPNSNSGDRERIRLYGIHGVAVLNGLWGVLVPMSAVRLYGWMKFSSVSLGALAIHGMDWLLWLVPPGLLLAAWAILGLYRRHDSARRLSLSLAGVAVAVYAVYLAAALAAPGRLRSIPFAVGCAKTKHLHSLSKSRNAKPNTTIPKSYGPPRTAAARKA